MKIYKKASLDDSFNNEKNVTAYKQNRNCSQKNSEQNK